MIILLKEWSGCGETTGWPGRKIPLWKFGMHEASTSRKLRIHWSVSCYGYGGVMWNLQLLLIDHHFMIQEFILEVFKANITYSGME